MYIPEQQIQKTPIKPQSQDTMNKKFRKWLPTLPNNIFLLIYQESHK
jgi:hypothetical protein